jgi:hypothetical protein
LPARHSSGTIARVSTIPAHWQPRHRPDDDELVGYLVPDGDLVVPVTIFGVPLAAASDQDGAEAVLDAEGLACLADQWLLAAPDAAPGDLTGAIAVAVAEISPDRLVLRVVDFGSTDYGCRIELAVPVCREMVRAGRLSGVHQAVPTPER